MSAPSGTYMLLLLPLREYDGEAARGCVAAATRQSSSDAPGRPSWADIAASAAAEGCECTAGGGARPSLRDVLAPVRAVTGGLSVPAALPMPVAEAESAAVPVVRDSESVDPV